MPAAAPPPPTPSNTAAVVVTYFPGRDLTDRLSAIAPQVGRVFVADNGSAPSVAASVTAVTAGRATLVENGRNLGIATALNVGTRLAAAAGFRWVLTMDQDSRVHADLMGGLARVYRDCPFRDRLGIIAANFHDAHRGRLFFGGNATGRRSYLEQPAVITSGSLVSVDAWRSAGPYRDDFFIDFVDHEFCLRLRRRGWRVVSSRAPLLDHAIGHPHQHRLLWMRATTSNHSPLRRYYITRNRLVTAALYADVEPRAVMTDLWRVAGEAAVMVAFEPDRPAKLRAMWDGVRDAVLGRMGPRR